MTDTEGRLREVRAAFDAWMASPPTGPLSSWDDEFIERMRAALFGSSDPASFDAIADAVFIEEAARRGLRVYRLMDGSSDPEAALFAALDAEGWFRGMDTRDATRAAAKLYARLVETFGSSDPETPWGADDDGDHSAFTHGDDAP